MHPRSVALAVLIAVWSGWLPYAVASEPEGRPRTVVSFTFDDGWRDQLPAAEVLAANGMAGTFYINSGRIGFDDYLTLEELRHLQGSGHEIAGHTLTHTPLTTLSMGRVRREVCADRSALAELGFRVTNFAYPYGDYNQRVARVVQECGYNSARQASSLYSGGKSCTLCPVTEPVPLTGNRWEIRTPQTVRRGQGVDHLESLVLAAEAEGGWLPLVFHHVCRADCSELSITLVKFGEFVRWLDSRPDTTSVRTVAQVVGGEFQPVVGPPPARVAGVAEQADTKPRSKPLSSATAFSVLGYGVGQLQVIGAGILGALIAALGYRVSTRRNRYPRWHA